VRESPNGVSSFMRPFSTQTLPTLQSAPPRAHGMGGRRKSWLWSGAFGMGSVRVAVHFTSGKQANPRALFQDTGVEMMLCYARAARPGRAGLSPNTKPIEAERSRTVDGGRAPPGRSSSSARCIFQALGPLPRVVVTNQQSPEVRHSSGNAEMPASRLLRQGRLLSPLDGQVCVPRCA